MMLSGGWLSSISLAREALSFFLRETICSIFRHEAAWGGSHIRLVGRMILGCIDVWLVQLQCSSLNRTFLISWQGFLQGFLALHWLHFQAIHHMKSQRERSDGVGPSSRGGISSSFRVHGNEGLLPVFNECWMVHQNS